MTTATDVSWKAQNHLIEPLLSPHPSEETGLNSHFRSTFDPIPSSSSSSTAAASRKSSSSTLIPRSVSLREPRPAAYRTNSGSNNNQNTTSFQQRARGRSLTERFPGDMSHRPLDMLRAENRPARRAPHLRRGTIPGPDSIDRLDRAMPPGGSAYHHEGPFDAALAARNLDAKTSPLAAVARSNDEILQATPREKIRDAVEKHRPLDGVADVPSGSTDESGRVYEYEEMNLIDEGERIKSLKSKKHDGDNYGDATAFEMQDQSHKKGVEVHQQEVGVERRGSKRHSLDGLKRRIGSLRKKKD